MKQLAIFILALSLVSPSCQPRSNLQTPTAVPTSSPQPEPSQAPATPTSPQVTDITGRLEELSGKPCDGIKGFTCVTLKVPLNHFDPANQETIDVAFAVAPATAVRKGMLIWATGGPGEEGYDTPEEGQAAQQRAKTFVDDCITEIGIDPGKLQFFTTDKVAQDIESFRQAIGDDKFVLYGISYGTSVAQTYARAYADHLSGLILDGTLDTTQSGDEMSVSQWEAMNMVLLEVFKACDGDAECSAMIGGDSQAAYDQLAEKLADSPMTYTESFAGGKKVKHLFTLHMLDYTALYQLYGIESRRELMRALASANAGDLKPLMQLFYEITLLNPATGEYKGDPNFSDTMFFIVWCGDDAYYSGTSEERAAKLMQELQNRNGLVPRLDNFPVVELTCPYWPSAPNRPEHREPLEAPGVPTFVLNATLDPATPFHEGKAVFEHLDNGYHMYVKGGRRGIYHRGYSCPDQYIEEFLVSGILPDQREIICDWGDAVIGHG